MEDGAGRHRPYHADLQKTAECDAYADFSTIRREFAQDLAENNSLVKEERHNCYEIKKQVIFHNYTYHRTALFRTMSAQQNIRFLIWDFTVRMNRD